MGHCSKEGFCQSAALKQYTNVKVVFQVKVYNGVGPLCLYKICRALKRVYVPCSFKHYTRLDNLGSIHI